MITRKTLFYLVKDAKTLEKTNIIIFKRGALKQGAPLYTRENHPL